MDRRFLAVALASVLLLAGSIGAGLYLDSTGLFDEPDDIDPAVTYFGSGNTTCANDPDTRPRVQLRNDSNGTYLTIAARIPVSGPGTTVENATLNRTDRTDYALTYVTSGADDACGEGERAVADTQTAIQVPHPGYELFSVTVTYPDGATYRIQKTGTGVDIEQR